MEKILFVINNLYIGGIQRSLIELLQVIGNRYDITVFCINYTGDYRTQIPSGVKVIQGNDIVKNPELSLDECRKRGLPSFFFHLFIKGWSKVFGRRFPAWLVCLLTGKVKGDFDYAISYAQPSDSHQCISLTNEVVLYNVQSKHKYSYVHCDYALYGGNTPYNHWLYTKFEKVAAVSNSVRLRFIDVLPDMTAKTVVVPNACNINLIRSMSLDDPVTYDKISLVSVSRLGPEKGLARCVRIFKQLVNDGFDFEWHIVGDGQDRDMIESEIQSANMAQYIKLEGMQSNPYRYMKNASCLFLPSFHEAAPMVFNEAACLGVPVLSTNTLSARELVADRHLGVVCDNDESSLYAMLKSFLEGNMKDCRIMDEHINDTVAKAFNSFCHD